MHYLLRLVLLQFSPAQCSSTLPCAAKRKHRKFYNFFSFFLRLFPSLSFAKKISFLAGVVFEIYAQQTCKIGPMLAISRQGWQSVGKFANALPMLPMFCQHLCKRRNYCSSKFPRIFSRLCNDSGPFSFTYSFPICQKYFFFITIQPTLVEYWLNIGCQHRHYAFQPIQGQCWMPAPGQHWWVKFFLTIDNFL